MSKSWEQILGGYATDTLTEEEKSQLFSAALDDQTLFDALADEEAFKALLADPKARERILASLQNSGDSQWIVSSPSPWLSWFRRPSSLAWAGSVAAAGLALIFGWQMNKDWSSIVEQEQQLASVREGLEENDEMTFQSEPSRSGGIQKPAQDAQKTPLLENERVASLPAAPPTVKAPVIAKASKKRKRIGQASSSEPSEPALGQEVKKERRMEAEQPMSQLSDSAIEESILEDEPMVASSMAPPETQEKRSQELFRSSPLANQISKQDILLSRSAKALFYANKSRRVDAVEEGLDGRRTQQLQGGLSSQVKKSLSDESSDAGQSQEVVHDELQGQARGIRYRFSRQGREGKDETIDLKKFSGKWSDLQLALESNIPGHLYVLTEYGKGKWQWMRPESLNVPRASDGAIQVQAYQPVNFALSSVTNRLGKPVVSSITVLLASVPLRDLGKWFGTGVGSQPSEGSFIEHVGTEIFVIDPSLKSGTPLRVNITLEEK